MAPDYTGISISHAARDELRRFGALATGQLGQRVTMTDALRLAVRIATGHLSDEAAPAARQLGIIETPTEEQ